MALPREKAYWDTIAGKSVSLETKKWSYSDNSWKRPNQVKHLMAHDWIGHKILEIGTGNAVIGGVLKSICGGAFDYTGTELSDKFIQWGRAAHGLNIVQADVRELPGEGYTRIIAFDSLEHVRPEHREEGYAKIASVAAPEALLFIHFSYGTSFHDKEFDHPFGTEDLARIEKAGFVMLNYERSICKHPHGDIPYVFVVMQKA